MKNYEEIIKDLEAKLAESEKNYDLKYKHWIEEIRESDRLRVLLADKDKTIDEINKEFLSAIKDWKQLVEIEKTEKEQLKQQLAESEKENKNLEDDHNKLIEQYNNQYIELCKEIKCHSSARERFVKKVKELEEQIEEKDKNFKWLHKKFATYMENNQDKISFAVEQLEKVKELGNKNKVWRDGEVVDYMITIFESEINNQIEELKKEMK